MYRINQNGIKKIKFKFRFIEYVLYLCRKYAALGKAEASFLCSRLRYFAENSCMNLKIKILVLLITLFLFGGCSSEVNYSSQIINYDFNQLDGVLIYNRDIDVTIFELFREKGSGLVFVDNQLRITKKPRNYPLQDNEIIKFLKAYKKLNLSYCCIDNGKIIRVISNGIDYIKINKDYNDKRYLFDSHKQEYEYIGNDWYVKKM